MALLCDYCGDVTESVDRITVAFGHNQEIALKGATAREWFYYCDDQCAEAVKAALENLRLYAMHGEGSGLMWQLVEQPTLASDTYQPKPVAVQSAEDEEEKEVATPKPVPTSAKADPRPEVVERKARLPMMWFVNNKTKIPISEFAERQAAGTALGEVLSHSGTIGKMQSAGIATLEEAMAFTEAEFQGMYGAGAATMKAIRKAATERGLSFRPGPSLDQLGTQLRSQREDADKKIAELADEVLTAWGIPLEYEGRSTRARRDLRRYIHDCEVGRSGLPPLILDSIGQILEVSRAGLLARAMQVTA